MNMEINFKNLVALYKVTAISDSAAPHSLFFATN